MFIEMWNKMFKQMRNMAKISKIAPLPPQPKQKERDGRTETGGRALRDGGGQGILKLNVQHLFNICLTFCWTFCLTFCSTFCSTFCWTFCWTFCSTFDPTFCLDAVNKKKLFFFERKGWNWAPPMFIKMWNKMFKQMRNMAKISKIAPLPPNPNKKRGTGGPRPAAGHSGTAEAKEFWN